MTTLILILCIIVIASLIYDNTLDKKEVLVPWKKQVSTPCRKKRNTAFSASVGDGFCLYEVRLTDGTSVHTVCTQGMYKNVRWQVRPIITYRHFVLTPKGEEVLMPRVFNALIPTE